MRARITLESSQPIKLGMNYHQQMQGLVYRVMDDDEIKGFIHNSGFSFGKRNFKAFNYSRILGDSYFNKEQSNIIFNSPIHFYFSSPRKDIMRSFVNGLMQQSEILLGNNMLLLKEIGFEQTPEFAGGIGESYFIRMLSPVTIYSTLFDKEGNKKTYYYAPTEREFSEKIRLNLINKAQAFYGKDWTSMPFSMESIGTLKSWQQKILNYKGYIIKGWVGDFKLSGHQSMLKLSWEAGLGGKSSQGLGMYSLVEKL